MRRVVVALLLGALIALAIVAVLHVPRRGTPWRDARLATFVQERRVYQAALPRMSAVALAAALERESLGDLESFNSLTYAEALRRGAVFAPTLDSLIATPDRRSLLALLAVRRLSDSVYRHHSAPSRVAILIDALRNSRTFNQWGMPHTHWTEAGQAIVAESTAVDSSLRVLLADHRPAPQWGSTTYMDSEQYGYRVRDFAWAFLRDIHALHGAIPVDSIRRDSLIAVEFP